MARLLSVFALALFVMLIFSNVLVAFATLYRSREVTFLIQSPISVSTFFLGRFCGVRQRLLLGLGLPRARRSSSPTGW